MGTKRVDFRLESATSWVRFERLTRHCIATVPRFQVSNRAGYLSILRDGNVAPDHDALLLWLLIHSSLIVSLIMTSEFLPPLSLASGFQLPASGYRLLASCSRHCVHRSPSIVPSSPVLDLGDRNVNLRIC